MQHSLCILPALLPECSSFGVRNLSLTAFSALVVLRLLQLCRSRLQRVIHKICCPIIISWVTVLAQGGDVFGAEQIEAVVASTLK
jgi:hypothetical protein